MAAEVEGMVDQMPGLAAAEPAKEERGAESAVMPMETETDAASSAGDKPAAPTSVE